MLHKTNCFTIYFVPTFSCVLSLTVQPLWKCVSYYYKCLKCNRRTFPVPANMVGTATIVAVATYGFVKNFSPDFQYFSDYLTGTKNFTREQVTQEIYPVVAYCDLLLALIALLVTDLLQYKPVIVLGSCFLLISKAMLYVGTTVTQMQLAEMFYAVSKASNLGYSTYIYTQITKERYQFATSIVNITPKFGALISSLVGQILLYFQLASLENLLQINLVALFLAVLLAFCLPSPKSLTNNNGKTTVYAETTDLAPDKFVKRVKLLWEEFKSTYTNPYLLKWCIWVVIADGLIEMVLQYYAQALWSEVSGEKQNIYNGLADQLYRIISMVASYVAGKVMIDWDKNGDMILGLLTVLQGVFIFISARCGSLIWAYNYFVVYASTSDVSMVLYRAEMAQHLQNFGLIFGINQFLSIVLQALLTFVLTSKQGLALSIRDQFSMIGWCFISLGGVFIIKATNQWFRPKGSITITTQREAAHKEGSVAEV